MNLFYYNQIKCWCNCNQQAVEENRRLYSVPLTLFKFDKAVADTNTAAIAFEEVIKTTIEPEKILKVVPLCKGQPGPDWKLGTAFVYPYSDDGWLFVFEKDKSIGFLDKNLFSVSSSKPIKKNSSNKRNNLPFYIFLLVLALIIMGITIAISNS